MYLHVSQMNKKENAKGTLLELLSLKELVACIKKYK